MSLHNLGIESEIQCLRQLAQNPQTSPEQLQTLAESIDSQTRQAVAGNPNTPLTVLMNLGGEFPEQFLNNPLLELLPLEDPHWYQKIPYPTLCSLVTQEKVPLMILEWAIQLSRPDVLIRMIQNPKTPESVLQKIAQQPSQKSIFKAVVTHLKTSREALDKLMTLSCPEITKLAQLHINWQGEMTTGWREIAEQTLQTLAHQSIPSRTLENLAAVGAIPEFIFLHLPPDSQLFLTIAQSPFTDPQILTALAKNSDWEIRLAVAENPHTPPKTLHYLAKDAKSWIVWAVAQNPNIPLPLLERLGSQKDLREELQLALVNNPKTPKTVLNRLLKSPIFKIREAVLLHENWRGEMSKDWDIVLPESLQQPLPQMEEVLSPSFWEEVLKLNESNRIESPDIQQLRECSDSQQIEQRLDVAQHPDTPPDVLEKLSQDQDFWVQLQVASHPNTPRRILERLFYQNEQVWQAAIAQSPANYSLISHSLTEEASFWIGVELAANPSTPPHILEQLAHHSSVFMQKSLLQNPHLPTVILSQLAIFGSAELLCQIATHPNTSVGVLRRLLDRDFKLSRSPYNQDSENGIQKVCDTAINTFITRYPEYLLFEDVRAILFHYARDRGGGEQSSLVTILSLWHPQTCPTVLFLQYRSKNWLVRYTVAQHENTPYEALIELKKDVNVVVRAAAQSNLQARQGALIDN